MTLLHVASVVTKKTMEEFDLLKFSLEQYHECQWVISVDSHAYEGYKDIENVECLNLIDHDDCDHNTGNTAQKDAWMKVMMTKFDVMEKLINDHGSGLFLDCDMIFVNSLEDSVLELFSNPLIDAAICQHMTNNWQIEAKHGLYNGGMFHVKSIEFLHAWKNLSKDYKKYGFYFEQQPLEYVQRNFLSLNLPINYNVGWWRFNSPQTQNRLHKIHLQNDKIYFGHSPVVNFHVHTSRKLDYENFGQFLVDKIITLCETSNNEKYKQLQEILNGA